MQSFIQNLPVVIWIWQMKNRFSISSFLLIPVLLIHQMITNEFPQIFFRELCQSFASLPGIQEFLFSVKVLQKCVPSIFQCSAHAFQFTIKTQLTIYKNISRRFFNSSPVFAPFYLFSPIFYVSIFFVAGFSRVFCVVDGDFVNLRN